MELSLRISGFGVMLALFHHHFRANWRAAGQVNHILVEHSDAAGRYGFADGVRFVGAVDAIQRVAAAAEQVERPRAQRVVRAAGHAARP